MQRSISQFALSFLAKSHMRSELPGSSSRPSNDCLRMTFAGLLNKLPDDSFYFRNRLFTGLAMHFAANDNRCIVSFSKELADCPDFTTESICTCTPPGLSFSVRVALRAALRFACNTGFFIESFPQMCFEGKWLQNRLRADNNELRSLLAVDIQGHQRRGFCIVPFNFQGTPLISLSTFFSSHRYLPCR